MEFAALVRLTLGLLLAGTGAAKVVHPRLFADSVRGYGVPRRLAPPIAYAVIAAELCVAIALLGGVEPRVSLLVAGALFALFSVAGAIALLRQGPIDCGCLGGITRTDLDWALVAVNAGMAVAAGAAATQAPLGVPLPTDAASADGATTIVLWLSAVLAVVAYWVSAYARAVLRDVDGGPPEAADE